MTVEEIMAGESKNVEFKVQRPKDSFKYMKSVIAFSNSGGGTIVFGIDDKTLAVIGIPRDIVFSEIDAITTAISDSCEPTVRPDVYLQTIEDKTVIVVEIYAGRQRPYYIKSLGIDKGTYIRVAGTSRPAGRDLATEMYYEGDGRSYDQVIRRDLKVSDEDIAALGEQMMSVALANAKSIAQRELVRPVTKNVLLSWGLLAEDDDGNVHPTNGYVFLLGQDDFLSQIQCGMFKGTTRTVFLDKREYGGPLWRQIEEAFQFVLRNIRLGARLAGVYRNDIYELPPDSIRELIINAVMNCSFLQNSRIQVAIYDNRLEITSPGGLLPGVTLAKMREGYSKIRNRALAHAFSYMNLIEAWGSGIPKILAAMEEYGLPEPEFNDMEIGFRICLYRDTEKINDASSKETSEESKTSGETSEEKRVSPQTSGETSKETHTDQDKREISTKDKHKELIVAAMKKNPNITQKELAALTGLSYSGVRYLMQRLRDDGRLQRVGSTKSGKWVLNENV